MHSTQDDLPPFPSDIETVPIGRVSYDKLVAQDAEEARKILEATQTDGFFYLDLTTSPEGQQLLDESVELREVSKSFFQRPLEEKMQYLNEKGKSLFGYKEAGTVKTTDKTAMPDTTEFINVS